MSVTNEAPKLPSAACDKEYQTGAKRQNFLVCNLKYYKKISIFVSEGVPGWSAIIYAAAGKMRNSLDKECTSLTINLFTKTFALDFYITQGRHCSIYQENHLSSSIPAREHRNAL